MATQQHPSQQQLPRLFIPPALSAQQPMVFSGPAENSGALFSPSLPSAIGPQGMHPSFPIQQGLGHPMQTPMQATFFPQPPPAPARPSMHRSHPSVAQLAAAGILPPPGMPMTPLGQGFNPQLFGIPAFPPPFVPRSKRTTSMSVGGPPKAVLGGPQRKVSPMAPVGAAAGVGAEASASTGQTSTTPAAVPKSKKMVVRLPRETLTAEDGDETGVSGTRPAWARVALPMSEVPEMVDAGPPEISTAEAFPPDEWRYRLPDTVDVFLPGKVRLSPSIVLCFSRFHHHHELI